MPVAKRLFSDGDQPTAWSLAFDTKQPRKGLSAAAHPAQDFDPSNKDIQAGAHHAD
jgi:hypothetical protein